MIRAPAFACALAALALAGCVAGPTTAQREDVVERTAVVEAIDPDTREVRNFDRIEVGDTVNAIFYESVAARMAEPDEGGPTTGMLVTERAAVGERPAGATGLQIDTVVEVIAYDPARGLATFRMPEGDVHSLVVSPEMRDFAAARQPGDRVALTFTEAFAIALEPATP